MGFLTKFVFIEFPTQHSEGPIRGLYIGSIGIRSYARILSGLYEGLVTGSAFKVLRGLRMLIGGLDPLVSREWKNGSNSSYSCAQFLHSLLTNGKIRGSL